MKYHTPAPTASINARIIARPIEAIIIFLDIGASPFYNNPNIRIWARIPEYQRALFKPFCFIANFEVKFHETFP
ncbi:MAG: hypothetical protein ACPL7A_00225 [Anaerolineales bacterium]